MEGPTSSHRQLLQHLLTALCIVLGGQGAVGSFGGCLVVLDIHTTSLLRPPISLKYSNNWVKLQCYQLEVYLSAGQFLEAFIRFSLHIHTHTHTQSSGVGSFLSWCLGLDSLSLSTPIPLFSFALSLSPLLSILLQYCIHLSTQYSVSNHGQLQEYFVLHCTWSLSSHEDPGNHIAQSPLVVPVFH